MVKFKQIVAIKTIRGIVVLLVFYFSLGFFNKPYIKYLFFFIKLHLQIINLAFYIDTLLKHINRNFIISIAFKLIFYNFQV